MSETPAGDAPEGAAETAEAPSINVLAQYLKDLSFESPNAPDSLRNAGPGAPAPQIGVNVDVGARSLTQNEFEVELRCSAKAETNGQPAFIVEAVYAGIFAFNNLPQEAVQPALLVECPRMLFPFARRILADATRDGGFPPLMLDPIDFVALYRNQMAQQQNGAAEASAPEPSA